MMFKFYVHVCLSLLIVLINILECTIESPSNYLQSNLFVCFFGVLVLKTEQGH